MVIKYPTILTLKYMKTGYVCVVYCKCTVGSRPVTENRVAIGNTLPIQYTRRVQKRPNFLNSAPTSKEGALRILSASSVRF
jgi:hypothetical protein